MEWQLTAAARRSMQACARMFLLISCLSLLSSCGIPQEEGVVPSMRTAANSLTAGKQIATIAAAAEVASAVSRDRSADAAVPGEHARALAILLVSLAAATAAPTWRSITGRYSGAVRPPPAGAFLDWLSKLPSVSERGSSSSRFRS